MKDYAKHHSIRRLYLLPATECSSLLALISDRDSALSIWKKTGITGAEVRKRVYTIFKDYLDEHARVIGGNRLAKMHGAQKDVAGKKSKSSSPAKGPKRTGSKPKKKKVHSRT